MIPAAIRRYSPGAAHLVASDRPPTQVFEDFGTVAREAPEDDIGEGLEEAFRSDATPPSRRRRI